MGDNEIIEIRQVQEMADFPADGVLIPAVPRDVQGPIGAGDVAVGLVVGAFSASAFFLRPWAGGLGDRWGRRPLMLGGAGVFAVCKATAIAAPAQGLQVFSLLITLFFVVYGVLIVRRFLPDPRMVRLGAAILVFWPYSVRCAPASRRA